jgi:hypothetical protein
MAETGQKVQEKVAAPPACADRRASASRKRHDRRSAEEPAFAYGFPAGPYR